jgi:hypothetical protein
MASMCKWKTIGLRTPLAQKRDESISHECITNDDVG